MRQLTTEAHHLVEGIAQRHGFSFDAVATLLAALDRGNGTQAQFSHFEFGGMGQWSQGGMIMIGDMFNNALKFRVDQLCAELSALLGNQALFVPEPQGLGTGGSNWWPADCGWPASSGSQNDMHYAVFPATRRLAIRRGGQVSVYDTGAHQISGFSQQQGGDQQNLTFTSQFGPVRLYDLGLIVDAAAPSAPARPIASPEPVPTAPLVPEKVAEWLPTPPPVAVTAAAAHEADLFVKIERLHDLMQRGILSEAEFTAKKKDLLDRL